MMSQLSSIISLLNVVLILYGHGAQANCTGDLEVWDELIECTSAEETGKIYLLKIGI